MSGEIAGYPVHFAEYTIFDARAGAQPDNAVMNTLAGMNSQTLQLGLMAAGDWLCFALGAIG